MILPIDVVIPTYSRVDSVVRTVSSILECKYLPEHIIVVDQTKDECVKNLLSKYCSSIDSIIYVHSDIPSLTKARNIGMSFVKNDIVVCMDDDVDIKSEVFSEIYNRMHHTNIAMIAGWNIGWDDKNNFNSKFVQIIGYLFGKKNPMKKHKGHIAFGMFGRYPECLIGEVETEWAMGFFFSVKKSLCEKWKVEWDEDLRSYAYAEDLDFSYRYYRCAVASNMKCILTDKVKVHHLVSEEWRTPSQKEMYMMVFHRAYLSKKLFNTWSSRLLTTWADYGMAMDMLRRKDNWKAYCKAIRDCKGYRKIITTPDVMYPILDKYVASNKGKNTN